MATDIIIHCFKGGKTETKVEGARGKTCLQLSKPYLDALSGQVTNYAETPAMGLTPLRGDNQLHVGQ